MSQSHSNTTSLLARSFGVAVRVECPVHLADAVRSLFPRGAVFCRQADQEQRISIAPDPSGTDTLAIVRDGETAWEGLGNDDALSLLQKEIHLAVAEHARDFAFIHAGAVAWKGRVIVLPGESFAGKSTLVWQLVQAGAQYFSDEYAVFDTDGNVHPFALPISIRSADGETTTVCPEHVASIPQRAQIVAVTRYESGGTWAPDSHRAPETAMLLLEHAIGVRQKPECVLPILRTAALQAKCYSGCRGDSSQMLSWLESLI